MLQIAYASQGGIKGSGFGNKQEMIDKLPFWKVVLVAGKVKAVVLYKDKNGRKRVAMAGKKNDPAARAKLVELVHADLKFKRSWGETSGKAWGWIRKITPEDVLLSSVLTIDQVKKLSPGKEIIPGRGKDMLSKPGDPFRPFYYRRELKGELHTKIAIGKAGNKIT